MRTDDKNVEEQEARAALLSQILLTVTRLVCIYLCSHASASARKY